MIKLENYKIDKGVAPSRLKRLSNESLKTLLNEWSRVGNARAERMAKFDPDYSGVFRYNKEGKFGTKDAYENRESMIEEIMRIKSLAPELKLGKAREEAEDVQKILKDIEEGVSDSREYEEVSTLFRQAFAMFRDGHNQVANDFYDTAKTMREMIVSNYKSKYQMEAMIIRLYNNYNPKYTKAKEELKGFKVKGVDVDDKKL